MPSTHEVFNQPPPLTGYDVAADPALLDALHREGAGWAEDDVRDLGVLAAAVAVCVVVIGEPFGWTLPLAVVAGLAAALAVQRHAVRRLGGITGDVMGALIEVAATVTLVVAAMGPRA